MQYTYETPKSDVYSFFVFSFIGAAYGLLVKYPLDFSTARYWGIMVEFTLYSTVYIWPGTIYLRAALQENPKSGSWSTAKTFYIAQAAISFLLLLISLILLLGKMVGDPVVRGWYLVEDLRETMEPVGGARANENGATVEHGLYGQTKIEYLDRNKRTRFLRTWTMWYFFFRYIFCHFVYVPCVTIITLVFIALYQRPKVGFNDILFFCTFPTALALFWYGLGHIGSRQWALIQVIMMWNSIQLCYFIADSILLVDFQLGSTFLNVFGMLEQITAEVRWSYQVGEWFKFQCECWRNRSDGRKLESMTPPGGNQNRIETRETDGEVI